MHDLLEGVCPYEMKLILQVLIFEKKYIDIDVLNNTIASFNYGFVSSNSKPVELNKSTLKSKDGSIKQSASEM